MKHKGEQTKIYIKEKAMYLFAQKGFKDVTMKDICEATNLSRGGLYGHYDSTKQIFSEIIASFLNNQNHEIEDKIKQDVSAIQILDELLEKYKKEMLDTDTSLSIALYEYFSSKQFNSEQNPLFQQYLDSFQSWKTLLNYGISRQEFKDVDIQSIFDLIIFSYQGVRLYSKLMPIDEQIPDRITRQIKSMIQIDEENRYE